MLKGPFNKSHSANAVTVTVYALAFWQLSFGVLAKCRSITVLSIVKGKINVEWEH